MPLWRQEREMETRYPELACAEAEATEVIRPCYSHRGWIPVGHDDTRCTTFIDLAPGPAGTPGQLFQLDGDDANKTLLASSLEEYFDDLIAVLQKGSVCARGCAWVDSATEATVFDLKPFL